MIGSELQPPRRINLSAVDLDGTLLSADRRVGKRSIEALRAAHAQGVEFVREPVTERWGTVAVFKDLYGNPWDLIGP